MWHSLAFATCKLQEMDGIYFVFRINQSVRATSCSPPPLLLPHVSPASNDLLSAVQCQKYQQPLQLHLPAWQCKTNSVRRWPPFSPTSIYWTISYPDSVNNIIHIPSRFRVVAPPRDCSISGWVALNSMFLLLRRLKETATVALSRPSQKRARRYRHNRYIVVYSCVM